MATPAPFAYKIIGPGNPGGKTQDLIEHSNRIAKVKVKLEGITLKLGLPASAAVTPNLCSQFMKEAGCNDKDGQDSAKDKMQNCKSQEFGSALLEVYRFHFQKHLCRNFAVRSDDIGATGVLSTEFVYINTNEPDSKIIELFRNASIDVLSSTFSDDAKLMARLFSSWGSSGAGLLVNPFYGTEFNMGEDDRPSHVGPAFSASFLAPIKGSEYQVWQMFRGMAASTGDNPELKRNFHATDQDFPLTWVLHHVYRLDSIGLSQAEWQPRPEFFKSTAHVDISDDDLRALSYLLGEAMRQIRKSDLPLYAELVCKDAMDIFDWVVLQASSLGWMKFKRPNTFLLGDRWIKTKRVMGFSDKQVSGVHFADKYPVESDRKFNGENSNYLLVVDTNRMWDFRNNWTLPDYFNAGALVLITNDAFQPLFSHIGGLLRMLGIPVVAFSKRQDAEEVERILHLNPKGDYRVLVDESVPVGSIKAVNDKR